MANTGNMRRVQRGELGRLHPKMADRDQIYMGPPGGVKEVVKTVAGGNGTGAASKALEKKLSEIKAANEKLTATVNMLTKERDAANAMSSEMAEEVAELKERLAAKPDLPKHEDSLMINSITKASIKDHVVTMQCVVQPTDGPLVETITITVDENELDKLFEGSDGKDG